MVPFCVWVVVVFVDEWVWGRLGDGSDARKKEVVSYEEWTVAGGPAAVCRRRFISLSPRQDERSGIGGTRRDYVWVTQRRDRRTDGLGENKNWDRARSASWGRRPSDATIMTETFMTTSELLWGCLELAC
jgi:hypothetical protein